MSASITSPFLHPTATTQPQKLAVLHLRRDQQLPIVLQDVDGGTDDKQTNTTTGYADGPVTNTRFGSYPHTTLVQKPWGSQIVASSVNTGVRGKQQKKKRGIDEVDGTVRAASGFCHVLPPTPESWTVSLPHRTQIVYTPDYSFVLNRLRVRPGCVVLEAGAGSGSFTHAAARAVFNGYPRDEPASKKRKFGRVYSFEYHEPRAEQLRQEIEEHGLDSIVTITHRDVYEDGFLLHPTPTLNPQTESSTNGDSSPSKTDNQLTATSPQATQIFLDLPSPWNAIPHLTRGANSPLNPHAAAHLCCFLPCIEQVQRAVASLKQHDWVEISMQQLTHKRIEVRREKVGLEWEGMRGVNASPATVEESIGRLTEVRSREKAYRAEMLASQGGHKDMDKDTDRSEGTGNGGAASQHRESKAARLERVKREASERKTYMEGYLASRTEPDIKSHTSYLVFATLPMSWTD